MIKGIPTVTIPFFPDATLSNASFFFYFKVVECDFRRDLSAISSCVSFGKQNVDHEKVLPVL